MAGHGIEKKHKGGTGKGQLSKRRKLLETLGPDILVKGLPLCSGCLAETALRFILRAYGPKTILFSAPGCAATAIMGKGTSQTMLASSYACLMTNVPSSMTGVKRYLDRKGKEVTCVAFVGDGTTADVGFQPLSGAAERNERIIFICYDNEAYMNTGIQRSSTTPWGAWTNTTPIGEKERGKRYNPKNMPLIMAMHDIPFVATATMGFPEDFYAKLLKAKEVSDGMSYIHLLSPCVVGWRYAPGKGVEVSRKAVLTRYFPLWEMERGRFRITRPVKKPRPLTEFTGLVGRFAHLDPGELAHMEDRITEGYQKIVALSKMDA